MGVLRAHKGNHGDWYSKILAKTNQRVSLTTTSLRFIVTITTNYELFDFSFAFNFTWTINHENVCVQVNENLFNEDFTGDS